jgi:hypothetical protein
MQRQPTLLNSCARATTAAEARYRISYPEFAGRNSRAIALDDQAAAIVRRMAGERWSGGHFLVFDAVIPANGSGREGADARLRRADGPGHADVLLSDELNEADAVVMVGTVHASAEAASVIGDACAARSIMSAGLVVPGAGSADEVVSALRPNAMVLVVLRDDQDIPEILSALRV